MTALYFLLIPLLVVVVASVYLYLRGRKPTGLHSGIDGFRKEMHALSPDSGPRPRRFESDRARRVEPGEGG
ncbi:MAG: hypothetical protein GXY13_06585 [Acidimicrobiales bacterium]|nr:hypothetical protein [Acidimicrobiales bacterium]